MSDYCKGSFHWKIPTSCIKYLSEPYVLSVDYIKAKFLCSSGASTTIQSPSALGKVSGIPGPHSLQKECPRFQVRMFPGSQQKEMHFLSRQKHFNHSGSSNIKLKQKNFFAIKFIIIILCTEKSVGSDGFTSKMFCKSQMLRNVSICLKIVWRYVLKWRGENK